MTVLEQIKAVRYMINDEYTIIEVSDVQVKELNEELGLYRIIPSIKRETLDRFREMYEIKINEIMLFNGYYHHHTAIHPGGIRKRSPVSAEVHPYDGRFGIGYTVHRYKEGSDNSHYVDYWIKGD